MNLEHVHTLSHVTPQIKIHKKKKKKYFGLISALRPFNTFEVISGTVS